MARGERALAQQIELVLVEAALKAEQQPVVALPGGVDRLLVDEQRVYHPAHLDQLLPVATVSGKTRDLARGDRPHVAQTYLSHHPLEPGTRRTARRGPPKILVDDFDLGPTKLRQALAHGVLQRPALAIVGHLMRRGLAYVQHRLACPVLNTDLLSAHRRRSPAPDSARARRRAERARAEWSRPDGSEPEDAPSLASWADASRTDPEGGSAESPGGGELASRSPDRGPAERIGLRSVASAPPVTSPSSACKARNASRLGTGSSARCIGRHHAASSIQTGSSCARSAESPSTAVQRATAPVGCRVTLWTRTVFPAHGCHA